MYIKYYCIQLLIQRLELYFIDNMHHVSVITWRDKSIPLPVDVQNLPDGIADQTNLFFRQNHKTQYLNKTTDPLTETIKHRFNKDTSKDQLTKQRFNQFSDLLISQKI